MSTDTTDPSYWLNWRFLLCALWILTAMVVSALILWKFEGSKSNKSRTGRADSQVGMVGTLYKREAWTACLRVIHPAWLLGYRLTAFSVLLALFIANIVLDGGGIFYFYTQWTFTLVTMYFGIASLFSICGCFQCCNEVDGDRVNHTAVDAERGNYVAPTLEENDNVTNMSKSPNNYEDPLLCKTANLWGYIFQVIYQTCGGAVMLTDCVFWFVIYPFLTPEGYRLKFLDVGMHSFNAVFLLGDVVLNCMRFPFFRMAYFVSWTCIYVIFQWIIHACVSMWWPYAFLDLSSPYAPLWYVAVGILHVPCYGVFALIVRMKHHFLPRSFPRSFQCTT